MCCEFEGCVVGFVRTWLVIEGKVGLLEVYTVS
jgi:hypothetical protein